MVDLYANNYIFNLTIGRGDVKVAYQLVLALELRVTQEAYCAYNIYLRRGDQMNLETFNYYSDSRVISAMSGDTRLVIKTDKRAGVVYLNARLIGSPEVESKYGLYFESTEEGLVFKFDAPIRNEICSRCDGDGSVCDPAIDAGGIDFSSLDPEFEEAYMAGRYDIVCPHCKGNRIVHGIDYDALECNPESYKELEGVLDHMKSTRFEIEEEAERVANASAWGF